MPQTDWLKPLDPQTYKCRNLEGWQRNADYWFSEPLRHVVDNDQLIDITVERLVRPGITVVDMGCGEGFLYRRIRERFPDVRYIGLDFNATFIHALSSAHEDDALAEFRRCDFEENIPQDLEGCADVVFSFFVLLEIQNIASSYEFADRLLKPKGIMSIWTIEYTHLILAISRTYEDFKENLGRYEDIRSGGSTPYTFQKIDLGDDESRELTYGSVFHSTADYISHGLSRGWALSGMWENIETRKFHPKVYQIFEFQKGERNG